MIDWRTDSDPSPETELGPAHDDLRAELTAELHRLRDSNGGPVARP